MSTIRRLSSRSSLTALAAALLASACTTVDLGPRYDPPPVRMPEPLPAPQDPLPPIAQPQPVPPAQPVPQPLPPVGQTVPPGTPPVSADPTAHLVALTTRLDGASVMPPTRSNGTGQIDAVYDSHTRVLRWKTSWSGLSGPITSVQFHGPAGQGQNAPAVLAWPAPFGPTYEGRATLSPNQAVDLLDGRWYLSVYTASYPLGELRGQLRVVH